MNIEIRGIGFGNKGAELMLCAIMDRLGKSIPDVRFVVDPHAGTYEQRVRYGLSQKMNNRRSGRLGWLIDKLMHGGYRKKYGLVSETEIDVLLDASGFAYGDDWKPEWITHSAVTIERYKKAGKKVILLPQALGPFTKDSVRVASKRVLFNADLVFARDSESYEHVKGLLPGIRTVSIKPDFTNLIQGHAPSDAEVLSKRACIIPNMKMIEKGDSEARSTYISFLASCIKTLKERNIESFILQHEDPSDTEIINQLLEATDQSIEVIKDEDPLYLKGTIGSSYLVIGSRYHSLVSALSQAVPSIGTSWSHKYEHLFDDYSCPENLLPISTSEANLKKVIERLTIDSERNLVIERLRQSSEQQKQIAEEMWNSVELLLKSIKENK